MTYWLSAGPGTEGSGITKAPFLPPLLDGLVDLPDRANVLIQHDVLMPAGSHYFAYRLTNPVKGYQTESRFYDSMAELLEAVNRRIKEN